MMLQSRDQIEIVKSIQVVASIDIGTIPICHHDKYFCHDDKFICHHDKYFCHDDKKIGIVIMTNICHDDKSILDKIPSKSYYPPSWQKALQLCSFFVSSRSLWSAVRQYAVPVHKCRRTTFVESKSRHMGRQDSPQCNIGSSEQMIGATPNEEHQTVHKWPLRMKNNSRRRDG